MKLNELENILLEHCYEMSILRRDANQKKKDSILDSLIAAITRKPIFVICFAILNKAVR